MTTTTPEREPLHKRIVWARKRKGISQERLAGMIGTSRRHMIRIEKGQHMPGPDFRRRIAEATGQEVEFFEDGTPDDTDEEAAQLMRLPVQDLFALLIDRAVEAKLAARDGSAA